MAEKIPQVSLENIRGLAISSKKVVSEGGVTHVTKVSFEVEASPQSVARLLYFARQNPPMNVIVESPQAEFDLHMTPVNIATGELATSEIPIFLK